MQAPAQKTRSAPFRLEFLLAAYFGTVLALAVARFASTPENARYQLLLSLLPAAFVGSTSWLQGRTMVSGPTFVGLAAAGSLLLLQAAFHPTTEARGYVLAAIAWLSFFVALRLGSGRRDPGNPPGAADPLVRALVLALVSIGASEALYGLLQAVGEFDQIGGYSRHLGRMATGTFMNRNHFAGLLNMTLGLSLGMLYSGFAERRVGGQRGSETLAWTWLFILSCTVAGLAVFLSRSRAGSLILVANLVFVFVALQVRGQIRGRGRNRQALPSRVVLVLLVTTLAMGFSYGIDALIERFDTIEESHRPQVYRDTLQMIADHPWTGVGPGMYRYRFRAYQTVDLGKQFSQTHNDYLQIAAEWGLPLAVVFWSFVVWCFIRAMRVFLSRASSWRQGLGLGCASAIFTLLLHSLVDFNLQIPANLAVFSAILGLSLTAAPPAGSAPTEVRPDGFFKRAWLPRVFALILLPLSILAAAWRIFPRMVATQIAAGESDPDLLEDAAQWDPGNPDYPYLLGRYYRDLSSRRDLEKAKRNSERAAELAPWSWRAHWELSQVYELLAEDGKAEEALLRVTMLSPRDPTTQWRLANLYLRQGKPAKMWGPLEIALAGDRSLFRPALGLLTKMGAGLDTIDRIWPRSPADRLVLLRGLASSARRKQPPDAELHAFLLAEWDKILDAPKAPELSEAAFFVEYVLAAGSTAEARRGWARIAATNGLEDAAFESEENLVWNGRFELPLTSAGLAWQIQERRGFVAAVAANEGVYESTALRIDFDGSENLHFGNVRQTVLVRSGTKYELSYQTRSEELTTDRGIFLEIYDPATRQTLLRTEPVLGTRPWSLSLATFETPLVCDRIVLRVVRLRSRQIDSRPAGTFWLDNVVISHPLESTEPGLQFQEIGPQHD